MKNASFWTLAAVLLAVHVLLSSLLLHEDSLTSDEPVHITAGYLAVKDRDLRINREHPPLAKALAGMGLMGADIDFPYASMAYVRSEQYPLARRFVFGGGNDVRRLTDRARLPLLLISVSFGAFFFLAVRGAFGDRAGLVALLLYAFSPTVLAHNHLVTTDVPLMVFGFAGVWLFFLALDRASLGLAIAAGVGLGLAMLSKFSGLFFPVAVAGAGGVAALADRVAAGRRLLLTSFALLMAAGTLLWGCWLFGAGTPGAMTPIELYLDGLDRVREHLSQGHWHPQFLLGQYALKGWWYYFPVAFVLKTSVFFQALLGLSVVLALRGQKGKRPGRQPLVYHGLRALPLLYVLACLPSKLNLGVRHLLPIFPFLFAFVAVHVDRILESSSRAFRGVALLLCGAYAASTLLAYPRYIGFFTEWARRSPERFLNDSNLDWGQDLLRLDRYMDREGIEHILLDCFSPPGAARAYLGDRYTYWPVDRGLPREGWFAVSEFHIMASRYRKAHGLSAVAYDLLDPLAPVARVGASIRVYRFGDVSVEEGGG